jgi:hypothetical protein
MIRFPTLVFAATLAFAATAQAAPQPDQPEVNGPSESACKLDPQTFNLATGPGGLLAALNQAAVVAGKAATDTARLGDAK